MNGSLIRYGDNQANQIKHRKCFRPAIAPITLRDETTHELDEYQKRRLVAAAVKMNIPSKSHNGKR
jgi:hypothetical protein